MLKLTYTEDSFRLERLAQPLEEWLTNRVIFALRAATTLCIDPSTASFLLPADLPYLGDLANTIEEENLEGVGLSICDADYVEVSLHGTWLAADPDSEEGILVTMLSDRAEFFIYQLWQEAQTFAPCN